MKFFKLTTVISQRIYFHLFCLNRYGQVYSRRLIKMDCITHIRKYSACVVKSICAIDNLISVEVLDLETFSAITKEYFEDYVFPNLSKLDKTIYLKELLPLIRYKDRTKVLFKEQEGGFYASRYEDYIVDNIYPKDNILYISVVLRQ